MSLLHSSIRTIFLSSRHFMSSQARISSFMSSVHLCFLPVCPMSEWMCQCYSTVSSLQAKISTFPAECWIQELSVIVKVSSISLGVIHLSFSLGSIHSTSVLALFIRALSLTSVIQASGSASAHFQSINIRASSSASFKLKFRTQSFKLQYQPQLFKHQS